MKDLVELLARGITSPFGVFHVGYIVLVASGSLDVHCLWEFLGVSVLITCARIIHDDCIRIILNGVGDGIKCYIKEKAGCKSDQKEST